MRKALSLVGTMLALAACGRGPETMEVTVEGAVVTLPPVAGRPGAAYFTLRTNRNPTRLVAITSPSVGRIELHETMAHGPTSRMEPLRDAAFTPDSPLEFRPGGGHAMVFELDPRLRIGDRVRLTFRFEPAAEATADAEVRGPGDAGGDDRG